MESKKSFLKIGKIHIFDIAIVLLLIAVAFGIANKMSGGELAKTIMNEKKVRVRVTVLTEPYSEYLLSGIKAGDRLAEAKTYIDASITKVEILPIQISLTDNNGDLVIGEDPFNKQALITYEGTATYKEPLYTISNSDLVPGNKTFLITDTLNIVVWIKDLEIIE